MRCSARVFASRLSMLSFSVSRSRWWTSIPEGRGPLADSHATTARSLHLFGSATLTNARRSPLRANSRTRIVPIAARGVREWPALNSVRGLNRTLTPWFHGTSPFLNVVALGACPTARWLPRIFRARHSRRHTAPHVLWSRITRGTRNDAAQIGQVFSMNVGMSALYRTRALVNAFIAEARIRGDAPLFSQVTK